jgi:hypothetical protein
MLETSRPARSILCRVFRANTSPASRNNVSFLFSALLTFFLAVFIFKTAYGENIGHIKPQNGSNAYNNYSWNGKSLRALGAGCGTTWAFDGEKLRKNCGADSSNTYVWKNRRFRPMSGSTAGNTWIWNGTELKPQSGATAARTWGFDGRIWSLKQGSTAPNSWVVSGFIPIPVCALVVLGLIE